MKIFLNSSVINADFLRYSQIKTSLTQLQKESLK